MLELPLLRLYHLKRFITDMYTVDEQLMMALRSYLSTIMSVASTIVFVSIVTPIFTLCLIPITFYYGYQQQFFTVRFPSPLKNTS